MIASSPAPRLDLPSHARPTAGPPFHRAHGLPWRIVAALLFLLQGFGVRATDAGHHAPPNLVLIVADDLGYGDLGCYGQRAIATPRLDALAREGTRFTRFYAGSTVCAPSRSVLMQGLHTGHCRVRGNAGRQNPMAQSLREDDVTLAAVLRAGGYATGLFGKWGLGDDPGALPGLPRRQGFDTFFGYLNQHHAHNYYPTFLWRNETRVALPNQVPDEDWAGGGRATRREVYSADRITDEALQWLRQDHPRPFLLVFTPTLPHANNEAGALGMEVPDLGAYADRAWPDPVKGHAAMVTRLDRDVGRLLDVLRERQLDRSTVLFFTSDNGPHREGGNQPEFNDSNGPLRGLKRDLYEGGIRVPMIAWGPGRVPAGRVSSDVWWAADLLPTLAALAGAEAPRGLDGLDASRLVLGGPAPRRRAPLYWEFHEGGFKQAVLDRDWKAVRLGPDRPLELYRIDRDPGETTNVAAQHPRRVRRMAEAMEAARRESADWPIRGPQSPQ